MRLLRLNVTRVGNLTFYSAVHVTTIIAYFTIYYHSESSCGLIVLAFPILTNMILTNNPKSFWELLLYIMDENINLFFITGINCSGYFRHKRCFAFYILSIYGHTYKHIFIYIYIGLCSSSLQQYIYHG